MPRPWGLALGPSLDETFCRKSWRLVTASQLRGPSSELRRETMVLAILCLVRNVDWRGKEKRWGSRGEEWRRDSFKTEREEEMTERKREGGGTIRSLQQLQAGGKSCYYVVHSSWESWLWPDLHPHRSINTSTHGLSLWMRLWHLSQPFQSKESPYSVVGCHCPVTFANRTVGKKSRWTFSNQLLYLLWSLRRQNNTPCVLIQMPIPFTPTILTKMAAQKAWALFRRDETLQSVPAAYILVNFLSEPRGWALGLPQHTNTL